MNKSEALNIFCVFFYFFFIPHLSFCCEICLVVEELMGTGQDRNMGMITGDFF